MPRLSVSFKAIGLTFLGHLVLSIVWRAAPVLQAVRQRGHFRDDDLFLTLKLDPHRIGPIHALALIDNRLCKLQEPFLTKMDALIKRMFAIPAHTAEGRRAKATVLLGCVLGDDWRGRDEETDYPEQMARSLLIEFVGGEPAAQLRDQFA
jgi:hypothetical protein